MSPFASMTSVQAGTKASVARGLAAALRAVAAAARAVRNRRDVTRLLDLDERALKDIGLTRSDVLGALAVPLAADPSIVLRLRCVERRARARPRLADADRVRVREACD